MWQDIRNLVTYIYDQVASTELPYIRSLSMMVATASIGSKRTLGGRTPTALRFPKKVSLDSKKLSSMIPTGTDSLDRSVKTRELVVSL